MPSNQVLSGVPPWFLGMQMQCMREAAAAAGDLLNRARDPCAFRLQGDKAVPVLVRKQQVSDMVPVMCSADDAWKNGRRN